MTADIREAFHVAVVRLLDWRRSNERQQNWGVLCAETGLREYDPEPNVGFFGRDYSLNAICDLAEVLVGPLPPHVHALFLLVDDYIGEPIPDTYAEAVIVLKEAIDAEYDKQASFPLTEPALVEKIRTDSFRAGAEALLNYAKAQAGAS
ncbi:hypothetical protein MKK58_00260 [Methylobacterium sp. J-078]|jgi:hypothetical protein|uniref:hypothetical protein n=1 Tax=Methylobacterium sp. J-078 TaxID=2836657 RepID=UPI001FB93A37|nr:hypothetical protein [Methylobacterium sp. J-078]MCJ2042992.1 hypothetical protein [Methylobacterium sp. J-078]